MNSSRLQEELRDVEAQLEAAQERVKKLRKVWKGIARAIESAESLQDVENGR